MRIHLHSRGPRITRELGEHAVRRLRFALGRFADRLRGVVVQFRDPNGPRGGVDAQCQVRASLVTGETIVVEELATDPFVAVARAAERVRRAVGDRFDRRRARRRRGGEPPAAA